MQQQLSESQDAAKQEVRQARREMKHEAEKLRRQMGQLRLKHGIGLPGHGQSSQLLSPLIRMSLDNSDDPNTSPCVRSMTPPSGINSESCSDADVSDADFGLGDAQISRLSLPAAEDDEVHSVELDLISCLHGSTIPEPVPAAPTSHVSERRSQRSVGFTGKLNSIDPAERILLAMAPARNTTAIASSMVADSLSTALGVLHKQNPKASSSEEELPDTPRNSCPTLRGRAARSFQAEQTRSSEEELPLRRSTGREKRRLRFGASKSSSLSDRLAPRSSKIPPVLDLLAARSSPS